MGAIARRWCRAATVLLAAAIAAGHFGALHRHLDLFSHFQVQYLFLAAILAATLLVFRSRRWACLAGACFIAAGAVVGPWYLPRAQPEKTHGTAVRLMLVNVLQSNTRHDDVIGQVLDIDPDVVVLLEVHTRWLEASKPLADDRPHTFYAPGGVLRGVAIYSRFPLENAIVEDSADPASPSASATLLINSTRVFMLATHPHAPTSEREFVLRNAELDMVARRMRAAPEPKILIGDINVTMWSPFYRRLVCESGLVNVRRGFGVVPTFPMDGYRVLRVPIDHCLVSPDIAVTNVRRGKAMGSDHAPLIVDIVLPAPGVQPE